MTTKNLKELILNRIAEIISDREMQTVDVTGKLVNNQAMEEMRILTALLPNIKDEYRVSIKEETPCTPEQAESEEYNKKYIYNIVTDWEKLFKDIKVPLPSISQYGYTTEQQTPCTNCTNKINADILGQPLICNCILGTPIVY